MSLYDSVTKQLLDEVAPLSVCFMFQPKQDNMRAEHVAIQPRVTVTNTKRVAIDNDLDYTTEGLLRRAKYDACQ